MLIFLSRLKLLIICVLVTTSMNGCTKTVELDSLAVPFDEERFLNAISAHYDQDTESFYNTSDSIDSDSLYFTFYSMSFLKNANTKTYNDHYKKVSKWYKAISSNDVLTLNNFDVLDSIYYYFSIGTLLDLEINEVVKSELLATVVNSQVEAGYFCLDRTTNKDSAINDPFINLTTLRMTELLSQVEIPPKYALNNWIRLLEAKVLDENDIEKAVINGTLYMRLCDAVHVTPAKQVVEVLKKNIRFIHSNGITNFDVTFLNEMYTLEQYLNKEFDRNLYKLIYLKELDNKDSLFLQEFHIMNYYYMSALFDKHDMPLILQRATTEALKRQSTAGYFGAEVTEDIDIQATYYASEIYQLLKEKPIVTHLIENAHIRLTEVSALDKIMCLKIANQYDIDSSLTREWQIQLMKTAEEKDFTSPDKLVNYLLVMRLVDAIKDKSEISETLINKILDRARISLIGTDSYDDNTRMMEKCISIKLLRMIHIDDSLLNDLERQIIPLTLDYYTQNDPAENLVMFFWVSDSLSDISLNKIQDNPSVKKYIVETYAIIDNSGLFKCANGLSNSMEYQYMVLNVLKNYDCVK